MQLPMRKPSPLDPAFVARGRFLSTKTFGSLDGLRAASILAVLWHHSPRQSELDWIATRRGFLGVDLFFVISGFLIVTLLLRERRKSGDVSLQRFYVRRFLRIFPVYYAVLLLVAVAAFASRGAAAAALRHDLPYAAAYLSNLVPMVSMLSITWSLSTEEQFYLLVPAIEKYARRLMLPLLLTGYVLLSLPPFGVLPTWPLPNFFRQTTFGPILLGVILAHVLDARRSFCAVWSLLQHPASPVVALALVVLASSHPAADISGAPRMAIQWALLLLVATCVVRENHWLKAPLAFWPLRRIGMVSYGIYLLHLFVQHAVTKVTRSIGLTSDLLAFVLLALASWGVAEASYRYYEGRFLRMKDRLGTTKRPAGLSVAADANLVVQPSAKSPSLQIPWPPLQQSSRHDP
jgi:peptidoglycan/LPS O-acetylase OafA/YrhL